MISNIEVEDIKNNGISSILHILIRVVLLRTSPNSNPVLTISLKLSMALLHGSTKLQDMKILTFTGLSDLILFMGKQSKILNLLQ